VTIPYNKERVAKIIELVILYFSVKHRYNQVRYFGGWYQRKKSRQVNRIERQICQLLTMPGQDEVDAPRSCPKCGSASIYAPLIEKGMTSYWNIICYKCGEVSNIFISEEKEKEHD
jgi:hypothetical protein